MQIHVPPQHFSTQGVDMSMFLYEFLFVVLWNAVTGSGIYNQLRPVAEDNCTYIQICNFEIIPARSYLECAVRVSNADSMLVLYDATGGTCSVCHPTEPDTQSVKELQRGQIYYTRGKCSLSWWRHQMEIFSALLVLCVGNSPAIGEFPAQRPVTRSFGIFFDLRLNKRLSKQSWGWWFETPLRPLWRHCNGFCVEGATGWHHDMDILKQPWLSQPRSRPR